MGIHVKKIPNRRKMPYLAPSFHWLSVEIKPEICKVVENLFWLIWKSMSELSDNIEKLGPTHAILRG